jgi:phosphoglycerate dehydrogenase-like enzyme
VRVFVTSKSFGRTAPDALDLLKDSGIDVVFAAKRTMTTPEIAAEIRGYDALIVGNDPVDDTVFAAADRLRLVHMRARAPAKSA